MRATPRELIYNGFIDLMEGTTKSGYQCKTSAFFRIQIINYALYNVFDICDLNHEAINDPKLDEPFDSTCEICELDKVLLEIAKAIFCINMKCEPEKYGWSCNLKHGSPLKSQEFAKYNIMHHHVILRPEISALVGNGKKYVTGDWILYKINELTKEIFIIGLFIHPDNILRYKALHEAWLRKDNIQHIIDELKNIFNNADPGKVAIAKDISNQVLNSINGHLIDEVMQAEGWN